MFKHKNAIYLYFYLSKSPANRCKCTAKDKTSCNDANSKTYKHEKWNAANKRYKQKNAAITENGTKNLQSTKQMLTQNATRDKMLQPSVWNIHVFAERLFVCCRFAPLSPGSKR